MGENEKKNQILGELGIRFVRKRKKNQNFGVIFPFFVIFKMDFIEFLNRFYQVFSLWEFPDFPFFPPHFLMDFIEFLIDFIDFF